MGYAPVTPAIIRELKEILGDKNVLVDEEKIEAYSHDETNEEEYGHMPEVVVTPETAEQTAAVVKLANREVIPVTPRGAGSGLSGGAIPIFGGILLSVEKMNKILEVDFDNMVVTAETGVVTNDIISMVKEKNLFYAGYPMSVQTCYLGGNIAENAGGGKAVKYGVTGRYIQGMEVVTPKGDIVSLGGKLAKDVSGYDLKQLLIGSEGTLGIVTKAIVKLSGLPTASAVLLVLYETARQAIDSVPVIISNGIVPTSIEFMDKLSVQTSCQYLNETLPYENCGAMLVIEVDGSSAEQVESDMIAIGDLCMENAAQEVYIAEDRNAVERIWNVRRNIAEAFKVYSPIQSLEDIVVPTAAIPDIIPELDRISEKYSMKIPCYGHAGDGNLHATLVKDPEMSMEEWHKAEPEALRDLYSVTQKLGGKISGEHGIGIKRRDYLEQLIDPVELELMKGIKKAWDPNNIMNPGKIFN
ncbi:FAD-binding oxidoreductase [Spirochaeta isovalerica]|uniref:Glycolate oxidase n=1 Tax=Spirochaeta isovalerica TaxID=150 RepID=A0A841RFI0_9SPIO|nr:FAD-linked oxidase C-terminal domain-containing protein [Spirochaeta isovalerica]MBB6481569.1 glycolate oxidase [Spirochaeta isovalerica]